MVIISLYRTEALFTHCCRHYSWWSVLVIFHEQIFERYHPIDVGNGHQIFDG